MVADAQRQALTAAGEGRQRAVVGLQQFAGMRQEHGTQGGELHMAGRALQQALSQPRLQALEPEADGRLRGLQGFSRMREAAEFGDADEGPDGVEIEGRLHHFRSLFLISKSMSC